MPVDSRDARPFREFFVDFNLILKVIRIDLYVLEFQGDFFSSLKIASLELIQSRQDDLRNCTHLDTPHHIIRRQAGGLVDICR